MALFHSFILGHWLLRAHCGHAGCRHHTALLCVTGHERGEHGAVVVPLPVLRCCVHVSRWNGADAKTAGRFQRESW